MSNAHIGLSGDALRHCLDTCRDALLVTDQQGIVRFANAALANLFGQRVEQLVGAPSTAILDRHLESYQGSVAAYLDSLVGVRGESLLTLPDGRELWVDVLVNVTEFQGERLYTSVLRDITARNAVEQHLRTVKDMASDGIINLDAAGRIYWVNRAIEVLYGHQEVELLGKPAQTLLGNAADALMREARAQSQTRGGYLQELEVHAVDGHPIAIDASIKHSIHDGQDIYTVVVRNISERKRVERMKSEFIATVSHELRTPLTSIHGSLGLIAGGAVGELSPPVQELITIAANNCTRLVRLINDILDIEKIESGKISLNRQRLDLYQLAQEAIAANASFAQAHQVRFTLHPVEQTLRVDGDSDRLRQVLDNLLSNAAKYTHPNDEVEITLIPQGDRVRVQVQDHGPGIPAAFRPRVFEKFAQADSSDTRSKGGTGLGLSICRAIVQLHQGQMAFDSEEGAGTCFWFELPLLQPVETPERALDGAIRGDVLICEDDPDIAKLLSLMLRDMGLKSTIAPDVASARRYLAEGEFRLLTLDMMLPDANGLEFLNELRNASRWSELPVIVISAIADTEQKLASGSFNMLDWVSKPIDEQRLLRAVQQAVSQAAGRARILHVEDDPDISLLVRRALGDACQVDSANSLQQARQFVEEHRYDLVVLDIGLPDGSGLELLSCLSRCCPTTPVIIFSAQELSHRTSAQVVSALVKSQTDIDGLAQQIGQLLQPRTERPVRGEPA